MDTYLPPKYSLNSFFVRHVAHPKRMKYISGLNNAKICAVNDVGYLYNNDPNAAKSGFPPNNFNEGVLKSDSFRRKERAVPPNGIWRTFGLIDNTDKWRNELNSLASSVGLLTQNDIEDLKKKRERDQMIKSLQNKPQNPQSQRTNIGSKSKKTPLSQSSTRLNEPLRTGRKTSRFSRQGSKGINTGSKKYIVEQADREAWMLQVLCQILQTDSLVDVQAWLVSASDQEKERIKKLIDQAMKGLEESGRIEMSDQNSSNYEQTQSLSDIENTLKKIDINKLAKPDDYKPTGSKDRTKLPNILKLDDDDAQKSLEPIPEVLKFENEGRSSPISAVFNINMLPQNKKLLPLENAVIKLETPLNSSRDYKIEQVKVSMLVKDEKSKSLQEINGDWKNE